MTPQQTKKRPKRLTSLAEDDDGGEFGEICKVRKRKRVIWFVVVSQM